MAFRVALTCLKKRSISSALRHASSIPGLKSGVGDAGATGINSGLMFSDSQLNNQQAPASFTAVQSSKEDQTVDVTFGSGATYRFHALWLRDACRGATFVKQEAGERILATTPLVAGGEIDLHATSTKLCDGEIEVEWSDGWSGRFDADLLRGYANLAGKAIGQHIETPDTSWLEPYSGAKGAPVAKPSEMRLWDNKDNAIPFHEIPMSRVTTDEGNLELIRTLLRDGVVKVKDVPSPGTKALHAFADSCLLGLQKDPSREEANWLIEPKPEAGSISYAPDLKLNNHTDQSLPNHGTPGLALVIHCIQGYGQNTIVDTFAVGEALRKSDPAAFEILTQHGNNQARNLVASRKDAAQNHTAGLELWSSQPIIQTDAAGTIIRSQYNEVFRTPSTVPFDKFKEWYAAYLKWGRMCHDPAFERVMPMEAGDIIILQNWRVMHGRDGKRDGTKSNLQSPDRVITGGTVTRENIYCRGRQLLERVAGVRLHGMYK